MKLSCSLGLIALVSGALACSSDGGTPRTTPGAGGTTGQTGNAGSAGTTAAAGTAGTSTTGNAGSSSGTAGTSGGTPAAVNAGDAFTIDSTGATGANLGSISDSSYGINGGALVIVSPKGTTATPAPTDGKLCMKGTTSPETVNGTPDYTNYWGGLIQADLNYGAPTAVGGADAGSDAGGDAGSAPALSQPLGWDPVAHNVKGFQFKVTGATVPASFRFQVTPEGSDTANDHFCANLSPVDGSTENVYFTDIQRDCYNNPPGSPVFMDAKNYTKLLNIQWQISANETIPIAFDFCVSDIKPILSN